MGDQWQKTSDNAQESERDILVHGTPEERINTWLKMTKDNDGHYKSGVCPFCVLSFCSY